MKHSFEKVGDHWEPKQQKRPSDAKAAGGRGTDAETAGGVDANASKQHLMDVARRLDIRGRSRMTKPELVDAIQKANRSAPIPVRFSRVDSGRSGDDEAVCTVLLRFDPDASWPLLVAAVRDEFVGRPWRPPAAHWPGTPYVGGIDLRGGGTWLAVDPGAPAFAALLNGPPLPATGSPRPTRGTLVLTALASGQAPADPSAYDAFHLLLGTPRRCELWSWTGDAYTHRPVSPAGHIIVNLGLDAPADPLVGHYAPLLAAAGDPDPTPGRPTGDAWHGWIPLLAGDGLSPQDPRALIIAREHGGAPYGSTSATLLALRDGTVRYDFTANPGPDAVWQEVPVGQRV